MNDVRDRQGADGGRASPAPRARPKRGRAGGLTVASALRRRLPLFFGVLAAIVGATLLATLCQAPRFTATAEVLLNTGDAPAILPDAAAAADARAAGEIRLLGSRRIARDVAVALALDRDPEFVRSPAAGAALMRRLRHLIGASERAPVPVAPAEAMARGLDRLQDGLTVARPEDTYALTIGYTAETAATAARVANGYARRYAEWRPPGAGGDDGAPAADRARGRIISAAEPPLSPSAPRPLRNLAIATVLGAALALAAAYAAERMFAGLTTGREIEDRLGLLHLGSVPTLASVLPTARSALDAVVEQPLSGFAEAFRNVLGTVRDSDARRAQVLALTSALPNEGKSTIAACLARTLALGGERVVLVDCDARRRDVGALFHEGGTGPGLTEVLRGTAALDDALVPDRASGAWLLPIAGPPAQISELLAGPAMAALIEELRRRFTRVLIDTAPVLALAETRVIATMVDLVVIVVRWRTTPDHAVRAALRLLPRARGQIAGVVLSRVDMRRQVRYAHGDASFYYRQYSKYYS